MHHAWIQITSFVCEHVRGNIYFLDNIGFHSYRNIGSIGQTIVGAKLRLCAVKVEAIELAVCQQ